MKKKDHTALSLDRDHHRIQDTGIVRIPEYLLLGV